MLKINANLFRTQIFLVQKCELSSQIILFHKHNYENSKHISKLNL